MISRERLKELIEKEESAWYIKNNKVKQGWFVKNGNYFGFRDENHIAINAKEYYETQEEAEWHLEFGNITRTERLELPTWKEFKKFKPTSHDVVEFYNKNKRITMGRVFPIKSRKLYISCAYEGCNPSYEWVKQLTKENYTLACRKCKELFLGEE